MFERYWDELPGYSGAPPLEDLTVLRAVFGVFPTFRDSPLAPPWPRLVAVGDASGVQSPVSFGGFGSVCRHLPRLADRLHEALKVCI